MTPFVNQTIVEGMSSYDTTEAKRLLARHAGRIGDFKLERERAGQQLLEALAALSGHGWQIIKHSDQDAVSIVHKDRPDKRAYISFSQPSDGARKVWEIFFGQGQKEIVPLDFNPALNLFEEHSDDPWKDNRRSALAILFDRAVVALG